MNTDPSTLPRTGWTHPAWTPPWRGREVGGTQCALVVTSFPVGLEVVWTFGGGAVPAQAVKWCRAWLQAWLTGLTPESREDVDLKFLYVLFTPSPSNPDGVVDGDRVAEVGRGSAPYTPSDWPNVSLRELVAAALSQP